MRFQAIILGCALSAVGAAARAETTCRAAPGGTLCTAQVDFSRFAQQAYMTQYREQWCWAASISMVFAYQGHPVSQARIVTDVYGSPANIPAMAGIVIANELNRPWTDDRGVPFVSRLTGAYDAQAGVNTLTNAQIVAELDQDHPMVIGARTHAMVLTQIQYYQTPAGPNVVAAGVFDPWPGVGARPLAMDELYPIAAGGTLRFAATVRVTDSPATGACPAAAPIDCGNGQCCDSAHPVCNPDATCRASGSSGETCPASHPVSCGTYCCDGAHPFCAAGGLCGASTGGSSCEAHATCDECARDLSCGWCGGSGRCMTGLARGPSAGYCPGGWAYVTSECRGPAGSCDARPAGGSGPRGSLPMIGLGLLAAVLAGLRRSRGGGVKGEARAAVVLVSALALALVGCGGREGEPAIVVPGRTTDASVESGGLAPGVPAQVVPAVEALPSEERVAPDIMIARRAKEGAASARSAHSRQ